MEQVQKSVEENFKKTGAFKTDLTAKALKMREAQDFVLLDNGTIVAQGRIDQQILVLAPKVIEGNLQWTCFAGPGKASPFGCSRE